MKLDEAILDAVKNCNKWSGGATITKDNNTDNYYAIPSTWLNDVSYTGPKNIVLTINDPVEVVGSEDLTDYTDKDLLKYINDEFIPCLVDAMEWNQVNNMDLAGL